MPRKKNSHQSLFSFPSVWVLSLLLVGCSKPLRDASDSTQPDLFQQEAILKLELRIDSKEIEKIKAENRPYVRATLIEVGHGEYPKIGVKIKGAAGSSRDFEDKPALTLNSDKFHKNQSFHGLDKFHLNNSVQDETYLHEWICAKIFHAAGYPATRVTFSELQINERKLGLFVLKEGFDNPFLKQHFKNVDGNLYDGGFLQDLDAELEKDSGTGPNDRRDLQEIVDAIRIVSPRARWGELEKRVDIDRFITFMALERMMAHWDGYSLQANNYRIYFDPATSKAIFFPHGMDQMFADPGMSLFDHPRPLLSSNIMQNNQWRSKYRERVRSLLPLFDPVKLAPEVDRIAQRINPFLESIAADLGSSHRDLVEDLKRRLVERYNNIELQLNEPDPEPLGFDAMGIARLNDWYPESEVEDAKLEEMELDGGKPGMQIMAGPSQVCVASWRCGLLLGPGRYRFDALVQTNSVDPLDDSPKDEVVRIRLSGSDLATKIAQAPEWTPLQFEFQVLEDRRQVELVAEFRSKTGSVLFEKSSMELRRLAE